MTKNGAIAKAKKLADKLQIVSVVELNGNYEVIHYDYLEEFIEGGYTLIANYKYDYKVVKF